MCNFPIALGIPSPTQQKQASSLGKIAKKLWPRCELGNVRREDREVETELAWHIDGESPPVVVIAMKRMPVMFTSPLQEESDLFTLLEEDLLNADELWVTIELRGYHVRVTDEQELLVRATPVGQTVNVADVVVRLN